MGICTQEAAQLRVVDPAIHVDQPYSVQGFVAGEAAGGGCGGSQPAGGILPVGLALHAKGAKTQAFGHLAAFVGDHVGGAQVIGVQVAGW